MSGALAILRVGACCSVGLDARQCASSLRAGVRRTPESEHLDRDGEPVCVGHLAEAYLPPLRPGLAIDEADLLSTRMLRLAGRALAEPLSGPFAELRPALQLAMPELEDPAGQPRPEPAAFLEALAQQAERPLELAASRVHRGGRAGLFAALKAARELLAGSTEFVLVGGVDSYHDDDRLDALEAAGRLRTRGPQDAFTPGEGAAFLLLASESSCRRHQLAPLAWIVGLGLEAKSEAPHAALAQACTAALAGHELGQAPVRLVVAGLNGERSPARDWGVAALRNSKRLDPDARVEHPAESFGDAGAALAAIMLACCVLELRAGRARGPALVWAGHGDEARGAALVYAGS